MSKNLTDTKTCKMKGDPSAAFNMAGKTDYVRVKVKQNVHNPDGS